MREKIIKLFSGGWRAPFRVICGWQALNPEAAANRLAPTAKS
jgi:hypothetical protein